MKKYIRVFVVAVMLALLLLPVIPAIAATTADVTVTATGAFVSYTSNVSSYAFGIINASTTTNTSGVYIGFTNTSSVSTNASVRMLAATWTSTGAGWTHSDTAAGVNTAAMKANSSNTTAWSSSEFIKFNTPYNEIAQSVGVGATINTGISLLAPTSFTDGASNNNTIRYTFVSSTP